MLCWFLSCSLPLIAADATGEVRFKSCSPADFYRLDLVRLRGHKLEHSISCALPDLDWALPNMKSLTAVPGIECLGCEELVDCKIQVLSTSRTSGAFTFISGNFAVELRSGQKVNGSFAAKFIKYPRRIICE
jgi:hypothetical protein